MAVLIREEKLKKRKVLEMYFCCYLFVLTVNMNSSSVENLLDLFNISGDASPVQVIVQRSLLLKYYRKMRWEHFFIDCFVMRMKSTDVLKMTMFCK